MKRSSFLHTLQDALKRGYRHVTSLLRNGYFWGGLAVLGILAFGAYFLVNNLIMPAYTRHDVTVRVPSLLNKSLEDAEHLLAEQGLGVGKSEQRFNPNFPRDVIMDQNPAPDAQVKPGRLIYLTINSGEVQIVKIPSVKDVSLREARSRLQILGLLVEEERPDSIPSPHRNTVTRQRPPAGEMVPKGSSVTLWYSTGPGEQYVTIPDVTGQTVSQAQEMLLDRRLRSVVLGLEAYEGVADPVVLRQSHPPGTRVREGFELRLFLKTE
ncbi:MAG: PASTA domain-containing protein [Terriglobia bacterium]